MLVAALAGILVGIISIIPFPLAAKRGNHLDPSSSLNLLGPLLLTLLLSFVVLVAGMILCKVLAPDYVFPFVIAEFAAFVVGVIVFGIMLKRR